MDPVEAIERYLRTRLAEGSGARDEVLRSADAAQLHPRPFITISRQAGAGGRALAETVLEVFARDDDAATFHGWQVFDQELCEIVADDPRFSRSLDALLTEEYRTRTEEFFHQLFTPGMDQDRLLDRVCRVVHGLAWVGKAVIVGRGGAEVTRGLAGGVSLRLVAPEKVRIEQLMSASGLDRRAAKTVLRRRDTSRARLLKTRFGVDIDDPTRYDATWNTGSATLEEIAEAVALIVRRRAATA